MSNWELEEIDDNSLLFRRVHLQKLNRQNNILILPSFFKNTPAEDPELSVDWNKYSTAEQSRDLIGREYKFSSTTFKDPLQFYIVNLNAGQIRALNINQEVKHSPKYNEPEIVGDPNNRAHSTILGDKTEEEIRLKLAEIASWSVRP